LVARQNWTCCLCYRLWRLPFNSNARSTNCPIQMFSLIWLDTIYQFHINYNRIQHKQRVIVTCWSCRSRRLLVTWHWGDILQHCFSKPWVQWLSYKLCCILRCTRWRLDDVLLKVSCDPQSLRYGRRTLLARLYIALPLAEQFVLGRYFRTMPMIYNDIKRRLQIHDVAG